MMKKIVLFLSFVVLTTGVFSQTKELSEKECDAQIRTIWENSSRKEAKEKVSQLCLANPNNSTSLLNLYFLRRHTDKAEIKKALGKLSAENQSDAYAKSLKYYVENDQLKVGDSFTDFKATTSEGKTFILSEALKNNKEVLLMFDGLSCIDPAIIQYLKDLNSQIDTSKVEIISFMFVQSAESLTNELNTYGVPWLGIADFELDHSKTKIHYNVQGTPTYIYINSAGKVAVNEEGALSKKAMKLLKKHI